MSAAILSPPEAPPDPAPPRPDNGDMLYEVVSGQVVEKLVSAESVWIASIIMRHLANFAEAHQLGRAITESLFEIKPGGRPQRRPDVAFVSYERWPKRRRVPKPDAWPVVPDIAIEVVSPSNGAAELLIKILEDFEAGVRLVWVVYPDQHLVHVYESPTQIRVFRRGDALDGAPVLPGFQLPLATLFEDDADGEE